MNQVNRDFAGDLAVILNALLVIQRGRHLACQVIPCGRPEPRPIPQSVETGTPPNFCVA
jgi:hypothetical protein